MTVTLTSPRDTELAVRTTGLTKTFGRRTAVDHLDLDVPGGRITGFVGPNGAGKTTTIRMLLGLVRPTSGSGIVLGEPLARPERYLGRVGALIEGPAFVPGLSGVDNLRMLARAGRLPEDRIARTLDQVGLSDRGRDRYRSFSLGMKQRLGIAAALLPDPDLLVLDEPGNGLDPAGIVELRDLLGRLRDAGTTVLVSSHLLSEVEQTVDHLVLLQEGRRVFSGPVRGLLLRHAPRLLVRPERPEDAVPLTEVAVGLGHVGEVSETDGADLTIALPPDVTDDEAYARAAELNRRAHAAGVVLARLEVRRPALEEAFLELTGSEEAR